MSGGFSFALEAGVVEDRLSSGRGKHGAGMERGQCSSSMLGSQDEAVPLFVGRGAMQGIVIIMLGI